jgi:hypothetical protein
MGMTIYDALVLAEVARLLPRKARVLTLGVPALNFSAQMYTAEQARRRASPGSVSSFATAAEFFRSLGFADVDALDISDYEGANILGDLNDPDLVRKIGKRYDLVYDSGTIEHIFDIAGALRTIHALVDTGGAVVHATPTNGFTDHGFWQVSPDLFRAAYGSSGYRLLTSAVFVFGLRPYALPAEQNFYRSQGRSFVMANMPEAIAVFAAQKMQEAPMTNVRLQEYYGVIHDGKQQASEYAFFLPFGSAAMGRAARGTVMRRLLLAGDALRGRLRALVRGGR